MIGRPGPLADNAAECHILRVRLPIRLPPGCDEEAPIRPAAMALPQGLASSAATRAASASCALSREATSAGGAGGETARILAAVVSPCIGESCGDTI